MQGPQEKSQTVSLEDNLRKQPVLQSALQVEAPQCIKEQRSFRFLDLPSEIRTMIYVVCLVSSSVITVNNYFTYVGSYILGDLNEHLDELGRSLLIGLMSDFSSRELTKPEHRWLNASLIRVSRGVYQEAALILYTRNIFKSGSNMSGLSTFQSNMTPAIRHTLQVLHLAIPRFKRYFCEDLSRGRPGRDSVLCRPDRKSFSYLEGFPHLETLHLHLYEDLSPSDIKVLSKINATCGSYKIILHAEKIRTTEWDSSCDRVISLHVDILAMMSQWGWQLEGEAVTVTDEN